MADSMTASMAVTSHLLSIVVYLPPVDGDYGRLAQAIAPHFSRGSIGNADIEGILGTLSELATNDFPDTMTFLVSETVYFRNNQDLDVPQAVLQAPPQPLPAVLDGVPLEQLAGIPQAGSSLSSSRVQPANDEDEALVLAGLDIVEGRANGNENDNDNENGNGTLVTNSQQN